MGRDHARYPHSSPWFRECPEVQAGDPTTLCASFQGCCWPSIRFYGRQCPTTQGVLVEEYLESEDIHRMDWPAKYPDLNPIEHAWDALGRAIVMCQTPPRNIPELKTSLVEEWEGLPQALLNSLINSMHARCACCLAVRGDHTPY